jgi:hypothetical protein
VTGNSECNSQHADEAPKAYEFELSGLQGAVDNFLCALLFESALYCANGNAKYSCKLWHVFRRVRRPRLLTMFTTHSTTNSPSKYHQEHAVFPQPPSKNARKT